jgi:transcriptional regulator GlxA family with amidase domain
MMHVAILIYDDCLGSEVFAFADTLGIANALHAMGKANARPIFEIKLVSSDGRPRSFAGGALQVSVQPPGECDLLVVPGMSFGDREALVGKAIGMRPEHKVIHEHWSCGKDLATICVGAFVAAAAGVTAGRCVATGWPVASLLRIIDSSIKVEPDKLVVTDGALRTTGAITSVYDLALEIIAAEMDQDTAIRIQSILLFEPQRLGQSSFAREQTASDDPLTPVHRAKKYIRDNLKSAFDLGAVAVASGMSVRSLQRKFKAQTGMTPLSFQQKLRIDHAKRLLESSKFSVGQIAIEVGYCDEAAFRKLFRDRTNLTPSDFRRRFSVLQH